MPPPGVAPRENVAFQAQQEACAPGLMGHAPLLIDQPARVPDAALAELAAAPHGCAPTLEALREVARRAEEAGRHARSGRVLAYARAGLRERSAWAELGLREAAAWARAGRPTLAAAAWREVWTRLGEGLYLDDRATLRMRQEALMGLWAATEGDTRRGLPSTSAQARHMLDLGRANLRADRDALLGAWRSGGWLALPRDRPALDALSGLHRARRKRKPRALPPLGAWSPAINDLLAVLHADDALVRALSDPSDGRRRLETLAAATPQHAARPRWMAQATHLALIEQQPSRMAESALEVLSAPGGRPWASEVLWWLGLAHIERGGWDRAEAFLDASADLGLGRDSDVGRSMSATDPVARALYWSGRVAEAKGDLQTARARFGLLSRERPFSVYHLLSVDALARLGGAPELLRMTARPGEAPPDAARTPADRALDQAAREAPGFALAAALDQARYAPMTPARGYRLERLIAARQSYADAHWTRYVLSPSQSPDGHFDALDTQAEPLRVAQLWASVQRAGARVGVHAPWLLALIREESGFRPDVCSPSKACGLMQLKRIAAETVAKRLGTRPATDRELLNPDINLAIGSELLRHLEATFGDPLRALAAYNAGGGAVRRWRLDPARIPADLFLERMPDRRARAYVIGIMVRYGLYTARLSRGQVRTLVPNAQLRPLR